MNIYTPDSWTVVKLNGNDPHYRVLASWAGGYLNGDSWKLSSGITSVTKSGNVFEFRNSSGSLYNCHKDVFGMRTIAAGIYNQLKERHGDAVSLVDENTDWENMDWIIK